MDEESRGFWYCQECGWQETEGDICPSCGEERIYELTVSEARIVARKLNGLELEVRCLSGMLSASSLTATRFGRERDDARRRYRNIAGYHLLQPCGHEQRFIVEDGEATGWCAMCENQRLWCSVEWLLDKMVVGLNREY